jgi:hypothetical protein
LGIMGIFKMKKIKNCQFLHRATLSGQDIPEITGRRLLQEHPAIGVLPYTLHQVNISTYTSLC